MNNITAFGLGIVTGCLVTSFIYFLVILPFYKAAYRDKVKELDDLKDAASQVKYLLSNHWIPVMPMMTESLFLWKKADCSKILDQEQALEREKLMEKIKELDMPISVDDMSALIKEK